MTSVRVPGKAMLSGEYAVLFGGTAVMVPVDRWLVAAASSVDSEEEPSPVVKTSLELKIPELADFESESQPPVPAVDAAAFFQQGPQGRTKLGLGASAAEAVATIALRFELAGRPWQDSRDLVFQYAHAAHRQAQSGRGSGADVAACCYGVPLYYRVREGRIQVSPAVPPARTRPKAALVWTGSSADSRAQIDRFLVWADSGGVNARQLIDRLVESSNLVAGAWFQATWHELFEVLTDFVVILSRCAREAGVPYKVQAHREIESWALKLGGKAKPVGAGGGDMVLVLGDLPYEELERPVVRLEI